MLACAFLSFLTVAQMPESVMLPIGKWLSPVGTHVGVGSYPLAMALSGDGKFGIVTTCGFRQKLSVMEMGTGRLASQVEIPEKDGLYYGLAVHPVTGDVYASRGAQDRVTRYTLAGGVLREAGHAFEAKAPKERGLPYHFAGLAFNSNGSRLLVVNNQTSSKTGWMGSVSLVQTGTGKELFSIPTSGFPLAAAYLTRGKSADRKAYVGSERDGCVDVLDLGARRRVKSIRVGDAPVGMLLDKWQTRLFVANSGSDTVSVIDTAKDRLVQTISLRPTALRGLPGAAPLGLALSDDETTLYVTLGDMHALAVVDARRGRLAGYVPTGWLPTSVLQAGGHLLVASAKGTQAMNPNGKPVGEKGTYIQDIIEGTVTHTMVPTRKELARTTARVLANNRISPGLDRAAVAGFRNPGIKHVIYIIKENRTYDNVLGDLPQGNGDPKLTLFPRKATPNQHAIAERFVLFDNFYVCAEVSQDGWQWSISGMTSPYISRNTPYNYSDRGRSYDSEGQNNGEAVDFLGQKNVATPASGTIWSHCIQNGVDFRNYGMYVQFVGSDDKRRALNPDAKDSFPLRRDLVGRTDTSYRHYDLNYADSPGYDEYGFTWDRRLKQFGGHGATNRLDEWKREFDGFVKSGKMPSLQTVRFGNDHTAGTRAGIPTPTSMVADNDYAVGKLVEAVSQSRFWKDTAIFVLEDDAQAGIDHVDAHRSTAYVISPFIRKGTVDSRFYNTDSMLRTIQLLLGMPPMSQYDAVAPPMAVFGATASNAAPYRAILPDKDVLCALNSANAYRAKDSEAIARFMEESAMDEQLNDILWKSIKGRHSPTPKPVYSLIQPRPGRRDADD